MKNSPFLKGQKGKKNSLIRLAVKARGSEVQKTMEKEKREQESCTSCAYRKDWYCPVAGDRVKREGHCSEYEKSEIAKEK